MKAKQIPIREELSNEYEFCRKSLNDLAVQYKTTINEIRKWLTMYNISIRDENISSGGSVNKTYFEKSISANSSSDYTKIQFDIKKLGLVFDKKHLNTVVFHNTNESREHFISKCILAQILYQKGHNIYTEGRHKTKKFDVIDLNTYTVYELESNVTTKSKDQKELNVKNSNFSLIIIDLKDLPKNIDDIFNFLNKKII